MTHSLRYSYLFRVGVDLTSVALTATKTRRIDHSMRAMDAMLSYGDHQQVVAGIHENIHSMEVGAEIHATIIRILLTAHFVCYAQPGSGPPYEQAQRHCGVAVVLGGAQLPHAASPGWLPVVPIRGCCGRRSALPLRRARCSSS